MLSYYLFQTNERSHLEENFSDRIISITIGGAMPSANSLKSELQRLNLSDTLRSDTPSSICNEDSVPADLSEAEWLRVWCQTRFGYPQPESGYGYKSITYIRERICPKCGSGKTQQDSFRIRKIPTWGRKHFVELNWVYDELFISDIAKKVLQDEQITGIEFVPVKNKSGTETLTGINQMRVTSYLQPGIIEEKSDIREITFCDNCRTKKYLLYPFGSVSMRREVFEGAPDVVKTAEIFGSGHCALHFTLIRKNIYELLVKNHLTRGLVFEPIKLI